MTAGVLLPGFSFFFSVRVFPLQAIVIDVVSPPGLSPPLYFRFFFLGSSPLSIGAFFLCPRNWGSVAPESPGFFPLAYALFQQFAAVSVNVLNQ